MNNRTKLQISNNIRKLVLKNIKHHNHLALVLGGGCFEDWDIVEDIDFYNGDDVLYDEHVSLYLKKTELLRIENLLMDMV